MMNLRHRGAASHGVQDRTAGPSASIPPPASRRAPIRVRAMQSGQQGDGPGVPTRQPAPGPQYAQPAAPPTQQYYPQQQPQYLSQPAMNTQPQPTTAALARRPQTALQRPAAPQQGVYIEMSQVVGKQVITRTSGRNLGVISAMWVDPVRFEVVSLDLDDKKGVGSTRICNFPLARLTQIGDVVLVHDEEVLYDQPLDGRYGYYLLTGMEVRTRSGEFLGKVRDFTFSPDTGSIARIVYDDFGLSFLPVAFFDTYSLGMSDVISLGVGGLIVAEEARYRERRESPGLFAAIPSLLRSLNNNTGRVAGALTDGYRQGGNVAGYLPQGYTYAQWEADVRRWEQETGMSYEQYTRMMGQQQQLPGPRDRGGAPARPRALPAPAGAMPAQQQQQGSNGWATRPQAQPQPGQAGYGYGGYQGNAQSAPQPQYGYTQGSGQGAQWGGGAPADPRARPAGMPPQTQPRQGPPGPQQGMYPAAGSQQAAPGWPAQPQQAGARPQAQPQQAGQAQYAQPAQQQPQQQQAGQSNGVAVRGASGQERSPEPAQSPAASNGGSSARRQVAEAGWPSS